MALIHLLNFIAGILVFVYGIMKASSRLENLVSFKLRNYLVSASRKRFQGLLGGFLFSMLTQSSSAASVIIITLVTSGLVIIPTALWRCLNF